MAALDTFVAPASEPLTVAEVLAQLRQDFSNQEPAPGAPLAALASPAAAGNVDNGAHRYLVVFVTAAGKTQAGAPSAAVTVANKTVNGKVSLTGIPTGGSAVTARELYRTVAGGSTYLLLATLADNTTTTYLDNIVDASLGAGAPATNTTADAALTHLIATAREQAEAATGCALVTQTLDWHLDGFPAGALEVPKGPLQSVTEIAYVDPAGVTQVLPEAQYQVDAAHERGRILPAPGQSWPAVRDQVNAVKVRYVAGFGAPAAVPAAVKHWMLAQIAHWDAHREAAGDEIVPLPYVGGLLAGARVTRFF